MSGSELSEISKAKVSNLKILFTSGYTDDTAISDDVIETDANFIQQPFTPEALANKIKTRFSIIFIKRKDWLTASATF